MIHEERLISEIGDGRIVFVDLAGREIPGVPLSAASGRDLEELELFLREAELRLGPGTNLNKWDGAHVEVAEMLDWMLVADQLKRAPGVVLEH